MRFGYGRVSTGDQNPQLQIDAIMAAGIPKKNIHIDIDSGLKISRKEYNWIIGQIEKCAATEVYVYRIDRLGRDHYELVHFFQILEKFGCKIVSICEPFVERWQESSWAFRATWDAIGDARYELLRLKERQRAGIVSKQSAVKAGTAKWNGRGPDKKQRIKKF